MPNVLSHSLATVREIAGSNVLVLCYKSRVAGCAAV